MAECAPSPSCFPWGKFSHFLACTGILRPVTPHRLALCPPLGQIVIFIYQLIAMPPALSPPSQETHVKRMKTGRQFHPSAPPSCTPLAGSLLDGWRRETTASHFHTPKAGNHELLAIRLSYGFSFASVTQCYIYWVILMELLQCVLWKNEIAPFILKYTSASLAPLSVFMFLHKCTWCQMLAVYTISCTPRCVNFSLLSLLTTPLPHGICSDMVHWLHSLTPVHSAVIFIRWVNGYVDVDISQWKCGYLVVLCLWMRSCM